VIAGSGHGSPLRAQCYLQWTIDQLIVPITIPTSDDGRPLLQLASLHLSKFSGTDYLVDSEIVINSPLVRKVATPQIAFDVLFDEELLVTMLNTHSSFDCISHCNGSVHI
jgi:hypothetical protein